MTDEIFTSNTHVARVSVMTTTTGQYRGFVYLRRAQEEPQAEQPHQTEADFPRTDLARDAARKLAAQLLKEYEF